MTPVHLSNPSTSLRYTQGGRESAVRAERSCEDSGVEAGSKTVDKSHPESALTPTYGLLGESGFSGEDPRSFAHDFIPRTSSISRIA